MNGTGDSNAQSRALYERYVKPLEHEHRGEYVAVAPNGDLRFAPTVVDAMRLAEDELGAGNFVFKVGEIAIGRWL